MKNLEELRKRLAEISASIDGFSASASFTNEDVETINNLHAEFESIQGQIVALEKIESMKAAANTGVRKTQVSTPANITVGQNRSELDPKGGFNSAGEFYKSVKAAARGDIDKRLQNSVQERNAEDGGFLIPTDFRTEIMKKVQGDESLLSRTLQLVTGSNHISLPINETAPWDGSGIIAYWEGEGMPKTESKDKFGLWESKLHKITALVRVTDEMLEDAPVLESWIKANAPTAITHKVNSSLIRGTGAGTPTGFLNSNFRVVVPKEVGQAAGTILFENVNNMIGRILPQSFAKSVWVVNPQILPVLRLMRFVNGAANPVPVYLPPSGVAEAPYGTLFGRPILPLMGGVSALGIEGDISLVDFSFMITAMKTAGIRQDISTHVYFDTSETAFRFVSRIAGGCPFKNPVKTEFGNFEMSGIVTLASRE